jgi:hypothetical protein
MCSRAWLTYMHIQTRRVSVNVETGPVLLLFSQRSTAWQMKRHADERKMPHFFVWDIGKVGLKILNALPTQCDADENKRQLKCHGVLLMRSVPIR